jgi:hypothetical protein
MSKEENKKPNPEKGKPVEIPNNIPNIPLSREDKNYSEKSEQFDINENRLPDFEFTPQPPPSPTQGEKSESAE